MSEHTDASNACVTASRVFVGDTVSRVFVSESVAGVFVGDATLEGSLRRLAVLANQTISGSDMVAVTTLVEGRPRVTGFTDDLASEIDDLQCRSGAGPCPDAVHQQRVIRVDWTDKDQRWPAFSRAAAARGILSVLCLPLVVHHRGVGALNCYSRTAAAFSASDERTAAACAATAAIALAYWDARHRGERLGLAVQSRATIEQAERALMDLQRCRTTNAATAGLDPPESENRTPRDRDLPGSRQPAPAGSSTT
jgi:transcriptional regulator with GAF, ATPase, and Fis domain